MTRRRISPEEFKRVNDAVATLYPFGRATARLGAWFFRAKDQAFAMQHFGFMLQFSEYGKKQKTTRFFWLGLEPEDAEKRIAALHEELTQPEPKEAAR